VAEGYVGRYGLYGFGALRSNSTYDRIYRDKGLSDFNERQMTG
jgi:hypothetical protein